MKITEQDILEAIVDNLSLFTDGDALLSYLGSMPNNKTPHEETMAFWNDNVCVQEDEVFEALLNQQQKALLLALQQSLEAAKPLFPQNLSGMRAFFKTEVWNGVRERAMLCVASLKDAVKDAEPSKTSNARRGRTSLHPPYLDFGEARDFVKTLKLKTTKDWRRYCEGTLPNRSPKPAFIPSEPQVVYNKKGWRSWTHWFGSNAIQNFFKVKANIHKLPEN